MQKFYTDKPKLFECKVSVDGASLDETKARLVLEFPNKRNLLFHGEINEYGRCKVVIPALKEIEECEGNVILEVIAESTYFESWRDKFELKTDKRVMVEVFENEKEVIKETAEPKVSVMVNEQEGTKSTAEKPKISPAYKKFKNYLRENEVNFNKIVKNKELFLNLLREYKNDTNSSKDDITTIVEEIKKEAQLLKS